MSIIYGIDTTKTITSEMVRDAVVNCFFEAHCALTEIGGIDDPATKGYCEQIVRKAFSETNGDFDLPTKKSILSALPWLAEFSKSFRDQSLIKKHMEQIRELVSLLND